MKLFKKKSKKACVIGLDGVPYTMIQKFAEDGTMPVFKSLIDEGVMKPMRVTLPEISSVSWSSFMTGVNPGQHGIFGFTDFAPDGKTLRFPSFRDLKVPTIWDTLGKKGLKSVVINQPSTYPARPINGVIVAGFVAIELVRAVSAPKYVPLLKKMKYEIDVETEKCKDSPAELFAALDRLLDSRRQALDLLWKDVDWNFLEVVVTGTDRLHHFMWDAYEDEGHPQHQGFVNYYKKIDAFIGEVLERFRQVDDEGNFFILSDHGFCGTQKEVYGNKLLAEAGFLKLSEPDARSLEAVTADTRALAMDPARIYLRRENRFPDGCVSDADVPAIKKEIKELFESLSDNGNPVVRGVFDGDEVYDGPLKDKGPDLLVVPNNGYDFKGRFGTPGVFGERRLQGMHTWDNAHFFTLRKDLMPNSDELYLLDSTATIMRSLDAS